MSYNIQNYRLQDNAIKVPRTNNNFEHQEQARPYDMQKSLKYRSDDDDHQHEENDFGGKEDHGRRQDDGVDHDDGDCEWQHPKTRMKGNLNGDARKRSHAARGRNKVLYGVVAVLVVLVVLYVGWPRGSEPEKLEVKDEMRTGRVREQNESAARMEKERERETEKDDEKVVGGVNGEAGGLKDARDEVRKIKVTMSSGELNVLVGGEDRSDGEVFLMVRGSSFFFSLLINSHSLFPLIN